jgi:hypothetical protein
MMVWHFDQPWNGSSSFARMNKTGRNDPCPCGSGKKYKHCCANAQGAAPPEDLQWRRVRRAIENMAATLLRYGQERYGPALLDEAWYLFSLTEDAEPFSPETQHMPVFMPWLFFDWLPDPRDADVNPAALDGLTLAQAYLRDRGRRIDPLLGEYLQACCEAPFSFYDVVSVRPGSGFVARDIFNGTEIDVSERSASTQMQAGDIHFAKIACLRDLALLEGLSPVCIPPDRREPILFVRKRMARKKGPITPDRLREWGLELLGAYHEIVEPILNPRLPVLQNTDGDPFVQHTLVYDIESPQAAFDALADLCIVASPDELLEDATRDDDGRLTGIAFDWQKAGNKKHKSWSNTVMGRIAIDGTRLSAEVNSEKRATQFRGIMSARLPGARYRTTSIQSTEAMLAEAASRSPTTGERQAAKEAEDLNALPEVQALLAEEMRRHYREWLDMKIPLLGNKTPRQAVRSRDGRELVEGMLLQIERQIEQQPQLDPAIVREMRESLGLQQARLL